MAKAERTSLSKKVRFDVFKRDAFTCQYCGRTPPIVVLEADHIIPVSKKGTNSIDNLITSCFDCNRGKADVELTSLPQTTVDKMALLKEREMQYKEYQKLLKQINNRLWQEVELVDGIVTNFFPDMCCNERFKSVSIKMFINKLGFMEVANAMGNACAKKCYDLEQALKYFCGICWNIIKNKGNNG